MVGLGGVGGIGEGGSELPDVWGWEVEDLRVAFDLWFGGGGVN